ncbi:MAG: riboflavin biosynthesis protein RibF [Planctomycetota bacterium]|jgi:riboflavin kinase/FMN adenylyltransferase|nr:riboflavin biosynthesis protein RibF [Planctomycetota bacterium]
MRLYTAHDSAPLAEHRPAVTLGVFDGVHLGHRAILRDLVETARGLGAPSLAITFSPHPRQTLGRSAPPSITDMETRLKLLAETGIDAAWTLGFTPEIAALTGREFAEEYFHRRLDASAVVLGELAHFGKGRDGNVRRLADWSANWNMRIASTPPLVAGGAPVSSTRVRLAAQSGDIDLASELLGRRLSVVGTVVHGQGLARTLGFPTLNLDPHHELKPPPGVYVTSVEVGGASHPSVTNVGRPPTEAEIEAGIKDFLIETHLLGYDGDLYGAVAEVSFIKKTRDVMRFASQEALRERVESDLAAAERFFAGTYGGRAAGSADSGLPPSEPLA